MKKPTALAAFACALLWIGAVWAQAQITAPPKSGPGVNLAIDGTLSISLPFKDQSAGAYTILAADNSFTLLVGAFSYVLPQAGSTGFPANWGLTIINRSTGNAIVNTTTSQFIGGGRTTQLILSPGASTTIQSDGTNWITSLYNNHPMITDVSTNRTIGNFEGELGASVSFTSTSPIAVALDANAAPGVCVLVIQRNTGQITFAPSGVGTLQQADLFNKTATRWAGMTWCVTVNPAGNNAEWLGFGRGAP